jgi:outer membrane protein
MSLLENLGRGSSESVQKIKVWAAVACLVASQAPSYGMGLQNQTPPPQAPPTTATTGMPAAPGPNFTQPLFLRPTDRDYQRGRGYFPNLLAPYLATSAPAPNYLNSLHLDNLVRNGKIYLSLSDAILLALQNNYDIAIQRLNLDIADTDLLRAKAGSTLLGINSGLVTGTQGGSTSAVSAVGGGPGGTSIGSGGAGAGAAGLTLSTNGGGPLPENLDPSLQGTVELQRQKQPQSNVLFSGGLTAIDTNTDQYNFTYNQGFLTGTGLQVQYQNSRVTTDDPFVVYSPTLTSTFNAQVTQHLLQGFGTGVNGRFIVQAKNDRRIADSAFRAQLLYTINQVENIYWGLVSAYEDVQAKQRALTQSSDLVRDDQKQLEVGALAPLDVVNAKSAAASDQQALIAAQSTLEYQQLVMKQAIARNLEDPMLANAPVIPTDRVSLVETPEENTPVNDLVAAAEANSPAIEQATLTLKNDEITLKGVKNGLLPVVDAVAFYGAQGVGGSVSPYCNPAFFGVTGGTNFCTLLPNTGFGTVSNNLINSSGPNKGVAININIPLRNRTAQAEQARSVLEFRQEQMRLQQLNVQIRMQVINGQYALTNDRAAVRAAITNRDFNRQSLDAEIKKLHLGASTTAAVLQQQRNLATAENSVISTTAKYATDRAALAQILGNTLDRYGISILDAATGNITTEPTIPGIEPARQLPEVTLPGQQQQLRKQQGQPTPEPQQAAPNVLASPQP